RADGAELLLDPTDDGFVAGLVLVLHDLVRVQLELVAVPVGRLDRRSIGALHEVLGRAQRAPEEVEALDLVLAVPARSSTGRTAFVAHSAGPSTDRLMVGWLDANPTGALRRHGQPSPRCSPSSSSTAAVLDNPKRTAPAARNRSQS